MKERYSNEQPIPVQFAFCQGLKKSFTDIIRIAAVRIDKLLFIEANNGKVHFMIEENVFNVFYKEKSI